MFNFIDDNDKFQLFAEGKLCLTCMHEAHCGNGCYVVDDDTCDCFECGCPACKKKEEEAKIQIGPKNI